MKDKQIERICNLTGTQSGVLYHSLKAEQDVYIEQIIYHIQGEINLNSIETALTHISQHYEVLRSGILYERLNMPKMVVYRERRIPLCINDLSGSDHAVIENKSKEILLQEKKQIVNLAIDSLFRVCVIQKGFNSSQIIFTYHHIVLDGWSIAILLRDFMSAYFADIQQTNLPIEPEEPFSNYINWLESICQDDSLAFWRNYLNSYEECLLNPSFSTHKNGNDIAQSIEETAFLEMKDWERVQQLANQNECTVNSYLKTVFSILLQHYFYAEDIVFGEVISGREIPYVRADCIVGLMIQTIPVRCEGLNESILERMNRLNNYSLKAREHGYVGLNRIQSTWNQQGELIRFLYVLENYPPAKLPPFFPIVIEKQEVIEQTNYEFNFILSPKDTGLTIRLIYNPASYMNFQIKQFLRCFTALCVNSISYLNMPVSNIPLDIFVPDTRREKSVTVKDSTDYGMMHFYERYGKWRDDSIAIEEENGHITYKQLNALSGAIGNMLQTTDKTESRIVVISMRRSIELVASMLAAVKMEYAFVCIDPQTPSERMEYIIRDCGCCCVLHTELSGSLYNISGENSNISFLNIKHAQTNNKKSNRSHTVNGNAPLYIVYTSGTTGRPKGVVVPHRVLINLIWHQRLVDKLILDGTVTQYANMEFDVCYQEIFSTLLDGGRLYIINDSLKKDPKLLMEKIASKEVKTLFFPTAFFNQLSESEYYLYFIPLSVENIIVAGEQLIISKALTEFIRGCGIRLHNHYGPSETHVVTTKVMDSGNITEGRAAIGYPVKNNSIHIIGFGNAAQPAGIPGEIVVEGVNVGLGYCGEPELTLLKFKPITSYIMQYYTGDYGVYLEDGELLYLCRKDRQVKIRGYRIEIDEIEEAAKLYPDVYQAKVLLNAKQKLVIFITSKEKIDQEEFKMFLNRYLPGYMMPDVVYPLEHIPLTTRGKTDYHELERLVMPQEGKIEGLRFDQLDDKEKVLLEVWQQLLIEKPDLDTNFFYAGGDSIKALQMCSKMMKYGYEMKINDLYRQPTIRSLSKLIQKKTLHQVEVMETPFQLTPIQKHFFSMNHTNKNRWNQSIVIYSNDKLDYGILDTSIRYLYQYHDALRLRFLENGEILQQYTKTPPPLEFLTYRDVADHPSPLETIQLETDMAQSDLDIKKAPLCKFILYHSKDGDYLVCIAHHLIIDAVSWRIMIEDLENLYKQNLYYQPMHLPAKTMSFQEWSSILNEIKLKELDQKYWGSMQWNDTSLVDYGSRLNVVKDSEMIQFSLSSVDTDRFLRHTNAAYGTNFNVLLLSALAMAIGSVYSIRNKTILLESHGRPDGIAGRNINLSRTVGWFTCMYPVYINIYRENEISNQIVSLKQTLDSIPNLGIGYGIHMYLDEGIKNIPEPEIVFNFLGQFDNLNLSIFQWADSDIGSMTQDNNARFAPISISGMIENDCLTMYIDYNRQFYKRDLMQKLTDCFQKTLLNVVTHCEKMIKRNKRKNHEMPDQYQEYDLSVQQKEIYIQYLMTPSSDDYLVQYEFKADGCFTEACIAYCFERLLERHEILCVSFYTDKSGTFRQRIVPDKKPRYQYLDLITLPFHAQQIRIRKMIGEDKANSFNLEEGALTRLTVFKTGESEAYFVWSFHHIIIDGWSIQILLKDWHNYYQVFWSHISLDRIQEKTYREYIDWQKNLNQTSARIFWDEYLSGYQSKSVLPKTADIARNGQEEIICRELDAMLQKQCRKFVQKHCVSENILYESVWGILLQIVGYADDIVYHIVHNGRPHSFASMEEMVGYFIKTIPVRVCHLKNKTLFECMDDLYENYKQINDIIHETSSDLIPLHVAKPENLFIFENYPDAIIDNKSDFIIKEFNVYSPIPADLFLLIITKLNKVKVELHYKKNVYEKEMAVEIVELYMRLLAELLARPDVRISDICEKIFFPLEYDTEHINFDFNGMEG